jgi:hypothetical protein
LSGTVVEWARIEFKETWDAAASLKTICAFANDIDNWGGGYLVIGVKEQDGRPVFPLEGLVSIKESLSNAVYHKGYDEREPIEVRVLPDRIQIVSHPGADRSVSIEGLKQYKVYNRRYRNRRIGDFLKELHLTEGRNTGFKKILDALKHNGSPLPIFETDENRLSFAVTIYRHPEFTDDGTVERSRAVLRHLTGSKNLSRYNPTSHAFPDTAPPGQAFVHIIQAPHFDLLNGNAVSSGASVNIDDNRIAEPYFSVTSNALLPIQPIPARVAIVLCGRVVLSLLSPFPTYSRVCAIALYPISRNISAPRETIISSRSLSFSYHS